MKIYNSELISVDEDGTEHFHSVGLPILSNEEYALRMNEIESRLAESTTPPLRYIDNVSGIGFYEIGGYVTDGDTNTVERDFISDEFAQLIEGTWRRKSLQDNQYLLYKGLKKDTWIEVKIDELIDLEIDTKISNKSRKNGTSVFLCAKDQKVFEKAKKKNGITIDLVELSNKPSNHIAEYKEYC